MTLKPNDIIIHPECYPRTIIDTTIGGQVVFYRDAVNLSGTWALMDTIIKEGWMKKEAPWKPKEGDYYWYLNDIGYAHKTVWTDDSNDSARLAFGNVFQTEEGVIEHRVKIIGLSKK